MISLNEAIDSLKGEVQDKSKNPFFGAFIATWLIRHWEVVYITLNFDSDFKLDTKISKIKTYFESLPEGDFWITIAFTFLVIIAGYIFLNVARIISNLSEKLVTPWIYRWTAGKSSIVTKETYDLAIDREKSTRSKLENQIIENSKLQSEIDEWEKRYKAVNKQLDEEIASRVNEESTYPILKKKVSIPSSLKNEENNRDKEEEMNLEPFAKAIWESLSADEKKAFDEVSNKIKNKQVVNKSNIYISNLIIHRLIEQKGKGIGDFFHFSFTPLGQEINNQLESGKIVYYRKIN